MSVCASMGREGERTRERERERERERLLSSLYVPMHPSFLIQVHEGGFDPAELGDTIRQLALSVQDTGMFGDLPRPRMMGPRGR